MSETETKTEKPAKAKSNGMPDENEMAAALALYRSIPADERKGALTEAQMSNLGKQAFAFLADGFKKLTGKDLPEFIILDGESGMFGDPDDIECGIEADDEGDEGDEEDEDEEEEQTYTAAQAVRMLRKWMKEGDYSQAYVAGKLRVTQPAVSTWLAKTSTPREGSIPRIVRLCSK